MSKPLLLDLFCGAGGAAWGYHLAGFEVLGVDIKPQPNYPFRFARADAITWPVYGYHAVHASPPCQRFSAYRRRGAGVGDDAPDLIAKVRALLRCTGLPFVIENVPGAPLAYPTLLCGSMFGLDVRRHRLFETNFPLEQLPCSHHTQQGSFPPATNRKNPRKTCEIGVWRIPLETQHRAVGGCEWMTREELSQAVPPAYTQWIGERLMAEVRKAA